MDGGMSERGLASVGIGGGIGGIDNGRCSGEREWMVKADAHASGKRLHISSRKEDETGRVGIALVGGSHSPVSDAISPQPRFGVGVANNISGGGVEDGSSGIGGLLGPNHEIFKSLITSEPGDSRGDESLEPFMIQTYSAEVPSDPD